MGRVKKAESKTVKQKLKTDLKKKVVKVRERHFDFSEQKSSCPICGTGNKTYRVLVQHCKEVHLGLQLVLICCLKDCGWHCGFSLTCFQHHMKYEHDVKVDGRNTIHLLKGKGDFSDHSMRCFRTMDERRIPNQNALKLSIEMDYCRREAKKFIAFAYKMGRSLLPDVAEGFSKEDQQIILEMYDHETYLSLVKKYPMPDHYIFENFVKPGPNKWNRLVAENIATHMSADRALARLLDE